MATFRVGQRVRIVHAKNYHQAVGETGVIVCIDGDDHGVRVDRKELNNLFWCGYGNAKAWQLEPIQDDGRKVVSWSECLWQPEGEVA